MREVWKSLSADYQVSTLGRVRSVDRYTTNCIGVEQFWPGVVLKPWKTNGGHLQVALKNGSRHHVHTLVLTAFKGPRPKGKEARHLNGKPADNRLVNLEWATRSRNHQDKKYHGNTPKFTTKPATVRKIRRDLVKMTHYGAIAQIARKHKVHRAVVHSIINGRAHNDVR